jgi:hypothetical protein
MDVRDFLLNHVDPKLPTQFAEDYATRFEEEGLDRLAFLVDEELTEEQVRSADKS